MNMNFDNLLILGCIGFAAGYLWIKVRNFFWPDPVEEKSEFSKGCGKCGSKKA